MSKIEKVKPKNKNYYNDLYQKAFNEAKKRTLSLFYLDINELNKKINKLYYLYDNKFIKEEYEIGYDKILESYIGRRLVSFSIIKFIRSKKFKDELNEYYKKMNLLSDIFYNPKKKVIVLKIFFK